ncbi:MAG: hypothetical protein RIB43_07620 [Rhodospirillaceae bacterium]
MPGLSEIQKAQINGREMAWRDTDLGAGLTLVLIYDNLTSSYLWRKVVPHLAQQARCLPPDLICIGESDKLADQGPRTYASFVHWDYFNACMTHMDLAGPVVCVGHNWGVPLAMKWAMANPKMCLNS